MSRDKPQPRDPLSTQRCSSSSSSPDCVCSVHDGGGRDVDCWNVVVGFERLDQRERERLCHPNFRMQGTTNRRGMSSAICGGKKGSILQPQARVFTKCSSKHLVFPSLALWHTPL